MKPGSIVCLKKCLKTVDPFIKYSFFKLFKLLQTKKKYNGKKFIFYLMQRSHFIYYSKRLKILLVQQLYLSTYNDCNMHTKAIFKPFEVITEYQVQQLQLKKKIQPIKCHKSSFIVKYYIIRKFTVSYVIPFFEKCLCHYSIASQGNLLYLRKTG